MFEERIEFAEKILRNGKLDENKFISQMAYIIRYLRYKGSPEVDIFNCVSKMLYDIRGVPSRSDMTPYINTAMKMANRLPEVNINPLVFSKKELDFIHEANNEKFETFVFVFFCIYKYYKRSDNYFVLFNDVFRESKIGGCKVELNDFINNNPYFEIVIFHSQDYLIPTEKSLELMFEENKNEELVIYNFINIRYQYLKYFGYGRYFNCEICNNIEKRIKNNQKYCKDCAKKMNIIKTDAKKAKIRAEKRNAKLNNIELG